MNSSSNAVEIISVTKQFGDFHALKGIDLTIREGEFFSLLGPSGCGKTTLLRMISGLETPSTGRVLIGGNDMANVPPHKRSVNTVFQSYALFPHLTVFENIAFGLKVGKKCPPSEISQRVSESLELVRLPHVAQRFPKELSGGQQQRIAFARAIVNRPLVLLLDEPLSALDPRIREEMQAELARFKRELGITFIMVTHDQSEAFALSDNIAVFNAGQIEQIGTAQQIYDNPSSAFVADFIGQTNVLTGKLLSMKQPFAQVVLNEATTLQAAVPESFSPPADSDVTVWIRTHAIDIAAESDTTNSQINVFNALVLHRSYQGETTDFLLDVGGTRMLASVPRTDIVGIGDGDSVRMKILNDDVRLLPPAALS